MADADNQAVGSDTQDKTENLTESGEVVAEKKAETTESTKREEVVKTPEAVGETPYKEPSNMAASNKEGLFSAGKLDLLNDVNIVLTIEIGRAQIKIKDLLNLTKGSIIELNKLAGEPVDIYANGRLISMGNIITANGKYCVRLISLPGHNDHHTNMENDSDGK